MCGKESLKMPKNRENIIFKKKQLGLKRQGYLGIEENENYKYFQGIIKNKRRQVSILRIMVEGKWMIDPIHMKLEF